MTMDKKKCIHVQSLLGKKLIKICIDKETTVEDVLIKICKDLQIKPSTRHLFGLRYGPQLWTHLNLLLLNFDCKEFELRIRFKVYSSIRLSKKDPVAYNYYFYQIRNDILNHLISDDIYEKFKDDILGLCITDMYRVILENRENQETILNDFKFYFPKQILKQHRFFFKKLVCRQLIQMLEEKHSPSFIKMCYVDQFESIYPDYMVENYTGDSVENNILRPVTLFINPFNKEMPGLQYNYVGKKEMIHFCLIQELSFVSLKSGGSILISRKNGLPLSLHLKSENILISFASALEGYYRLSYKWTINLCQRLVSPTVKKMTQMHCHGPIEAEEAYRKFKETKQLKQGTFLLRESNEIYDSFCLDVCMKNKCLPVSYKIDKVYDGYVFSYDNIKYNNIKEIILKYKKSIRNEKSKSKKKHLANPQPSTSKGTQLKRTNNTQQQSKVTDLQNTLEEIYNNENFGNDKSNLLHNISTNEIVVVSPAASSSFIFKETKLILNEVDTYVKLRHENNQLSADINKFLIPENREKVNTKIKDLNEKIPLSSDDLLVKKDIECQNTLTDQCKNEKTSISSLNDCSTVESFSVKSNQSQIKRKSNLILLSLILPKYKDKSCLSLCEVPSQLINDFKKINNLVPEKTFTFPELINKNLTFTEETFESSTGYTLVSRYRLKISDSKEEIDVALKTLKPQYIYYFSDFLKLTSSWSVLRSNAVAKLLGVSYLKPRGAITEYFPLGPLNIYLRNNKSIIQEVDLVEAATTLASALYYMEENGFVHSYIRCHKLYVAFHNENSFSVRLADPGYHVDYNEHDMHWIPPELYACIHNVKKSFLSDIWAYGTTIWQIFSYGIEPVLPENVNIQHFYLNGNRLPKPSNCSRDVYSIMHSCWKSDPQLRKRSQTALRDINQILFEVFNSRQIHSYSTIKPVKTDASGEVEIILDNSDDDISLKNSSSDILTQMTTLSIQNYNKSNKKESKFCLFKNIRKKMRYIVNKESPSNATTLDDDSLSLQLNILNDDKNKCPIDQIKPITMYESKKVLRLRVNEIYKLDNDTENKGASFDVNMIMSPEIKNVAYFNNCGGAGSSASTTKYKKMNNYIHVETNESGLNVNNDTILRPTVSTQSTNQPNIIPNIKSSQQNFDNNFMNKRYVNLETESVYKNESCTRNNNQLLADLNGEVSDKVASNYINEENIQMPPLFENDTFENSFNIKPLEVLENFKIKKYNEYFEEIKNENQDKSLTHLNISSLVAMPSASLENKFNSYSSTSLDMSEDIICNGKSDTTKQYKVIN